MYNVTTVDVQAAWDVYHDEAGRCVHYRARELYVKDNGVVVLTGVTGDVLADTVVLSPHRGVLRISRRSKAHTNAA